MWIGIAFALFLNGQGVADYALTHDEAECKAKNAALEIELKKSDEVIAYKVECVNAEAILIKRDPTVKPKVEPSKEPKRPQTEAFNVRIEIPRGARIAIASVPRASP